MLFSSLELGFAINLLLISDLDNDHRLDMGLNKQCQCMQLKSIDASPGVAS